MKCHFSLIIWWKKIFHEYANWSHKDRALEIRQCLFGKYRWHFLVHARFALHRRRLSSFKPMKLIHPFLLKHLVFPWFWYWLTAVYFYGLSRPREIGLRAVDCKLAKVIPFQQLTHTFLYLFERKQLRIYTSSESISYVIWRVKGYYTLNST